MGRERRREKRERKKRRTGRRKRRADVSILVDILGEKVPQQCVAFQVVVFCLSLEFDLETIRISTAMSRSILKVVLKMKMALMGKSYEQITVWVGGMSRKASNW